MSGTYAERDAERIILLKSTDAGVTWVPVTDLAYDIAQALIDAGFGGTPTYFYLLMEDGSSLLLEDGVSKIILD